MQQTNKPASKTRITLTWIFSIGMIMFWIAFGMWYNRDKTDASPPPDMMRSVFNFIVGGFFLTVGIAAYLITVFTTAFTFDFTRPIWSALKVKVYFANLFVPTIIALGVGFILAAFLPHLLVRFGLAPGTAQMLPIMLALGLLLSATLWVLIWAPVEKRATIKRLAAQGISPAHLQGAVFVGLSNPASGITKRFAAIEEDIGALWVGQDQLVYYGDEERFSISRDQLVQIERKADNRSTSVLGGIAHIILHVRIAEGGERQIRLHTEGLWTMGQKRRVMDSLAESIIRWHDAAVPIAQPLQST